MSVSDTALSADIRNLEVQDNSASAFNTPTSGTPIPTTGVSSETTALLDKVVKILKDPVSTNRHRTKNHSVKNMEFSIFQWMGGSNKPKCHLKAQKPRIILYLGIPYTPSCRHQYVCMKLCPLMASITQMPPFPFIFPKAVMSLYSNAHRAKMCTLLLSGYKIGFTHKTILSK